MPMTRHRYIYGNDNPISYLDPSGELSLAASATTSISGILSSITIPGLVSLGGILSAAFVSGVKKRLNNKTVMWDGDLSSVSAPGFPSLKFADFKTVNSPSPIKADWEIIP